MVTGTELLEALPVAVYTTDKDGLITFYNQAAAELWGHRPEIGAVRWCGSWRRYLPDGRPMPLDQCPVAVALREGRILSETEAVAERPDGTRVPFVARPTLLRDAAGRVTGAINLLLDLSERKRAEMDSERLASIVASSDDAIVSKALDGTILTWNEGARRIFGYEADEIVGHSIMQIIPPELRQQEKEILDKLQRGERIEHFDTVRVAKDGRRIDVSLTVSPLRDKSGNVVGASKIARDITAQKRGLELQRLLLRELDHRIKNTLAIIQAIATQSLRRSTSPDDFVTSFNGRVQALARAHDLLVRGGMQGSTVAELIEEQVLLGTISDKRISYAGPSVMLNAQRAVHLALVLHELATNARKYGALSVPSGGLAITWNVATTPGRELFLSWREAGVPELAAPTRRGFGSTLIERTLTGSGGMAAVRYDSGGITCEIRLPLPEECQQDLSSGGRPAPNSPEAARAGAAVNSSSGKRVMVVEDEPLVAMAMEAELSAAGYTVVGPAGNLAAARQLVAEQICDAALLDVDLSDGPTAELAEELTRKDIPFAFATGYGENVSPPGLPDVPILRKPLDPAQLLAVVAGLLRTGRPSAVVSLRQKKDMA